MKSVKDLLDDVPTMGTNVMLTKKRNERVPLVLDGLKPKRPPVAEGDHLFTPEELLSLNVNDLHVNGRVIGYQRNPEIPHIRNIARHLQDGKPVPTLEVALDGRGRMWLVDGQQRALAGVMARVSLWGIVLHRDVTEQAELFASQRKAKRLDPNTLVLAGDNAFERYVQEAVADSRHAWNGIVSPSRNSKSRIAPYALYQLLVRYVGNSEGTATGIHGRALSDRWDRGLADELAPLIRAFGTKQTNPLAFRPMALQSVGATAMWVFIRREREAGDYERWIAHMPRFPFDLWPHLRRQREFTDQLVAHWNKGLRGKRRVERP